MYNDYDNQIHKFNNIIVNNLKLLITTICTQITMVTKQRTQVTVLHSCYYVIEHVKI